MLSKEEYFEYYRTHGRCIDDSFKRKQKLNDRQLSSRYDKYVIKSQYKSAEVDLKWLEITKSLPKQCLLLKRLKESGKQDVIDYLYKTQYHLIKTIDPAHVFSRGSYPELKYDRENVVPLNRYSHSMLDQYRDPIYGEQIDRETHDKWWKFIVGNERYENLLKKINII